MGRRDEALCSVTKHPSEFSVHPSVLMLCSRSRQVCCGEEGHGTVEEPGFVQPPRSLTLTGSEMKALLQWEGSDAHPLTALQKQISVGCVCVCVCVRVRAGRFGPKVISQYFQAKCQYKIFNSYKQYNTFSRDFLFFISGLFVFISVTRRPSRPEDNVPSLRSQSWDIAQYPE